MLLPELQVLSALLNLILAIQMSGTVPRWYRRLADRLSQGQSRCQSTVASAKLSAKQSKLLCYASVKPVLADCPQYRQFLLLAHYLCCLSQQARAVLRKLAHTGFTVQDTLAP